MKRFIKPLLVAALVAFAALGIHNIVSNHNNVRLQQIELESTATELNSLQIRYEKLNKNLTEALNGGNTKKERIEQLEQEKTELENQKRELEQQLSARREQQRLAASRLNAASNTATGTATAHAAAGGSCMDWIKQAGIVDVNNAYRLIMRESSCNPNAINPTSGACGLGQQLPCGKWPHQWNDPVGSLVDMNVYVLTRYKSWVAALYFHDRNNWY